MAAPAGLFAWREFYLLTTVALDFYHGYNLVSLALGYFRIKD
jgi:hypothetical protein